MNLFNEELSKEQFSILQSCESTLKYAFGSHETVFSKHEIRNSSVIAKKVASVGGCKDDHKRIIRDPKYFKATKKLKFLLVHKSERERERERERETLGNSFIFEVPKLQRRGVKELYF